MHVCEAGVLTSSKSLTASAQVGYRNEFIADFTVEPE